jgi:hypothetical protein
MAGWVTLSMGFIDREKASANKLFVEAAELAKNRDSASLEEALSKLYEIIRCYPHTALAVKLASRQTVENISLEGVYREAVEAHKNLNDPEKP